MEIEEYKKKASEELVKIVDEHNKVIGPAKRSEMRAKNLYHRCTYIFLYNSHKQLYVQKRTMIKDYCPGYWDLVTGGIINYGEDELESAFRELKEEMGVVVPKLTFITIIPYEVKSEKNNCRGFGYAYSAQYDGPITMQPEEVAQVELWTGEEVEKKIKEGMLILPDVVVAYEKCKPSIYKYIF